MAFGLFAAIGLALMAGFPVAFTLAGVALLFAGIGIMTGTFDPVFLEAFPNRIYGIMTNETLIAVPVFVFMGVMLERSKLADQLLQSLAQLMRGTPGGLGIAVVIVGAMMAASTGIRRVAHSIRRWPNSAIEMSAMSFGRFSKVGPLGGV